MAATINIPVYSDALVVLGTAGVVVPLVRRFGLSPVLGYLGAGALLGPLGLGSLIEVFPPLYWVTVGNAENVSGIAELGVVFLLFLIGLELSFERLQAMRRLVVGLGGLQIVFSMMFIGGVVALTGQSTPVSIIVGASLALSSTAVVLEVLSNQGRLTTTTGRASFSVLLAQDIAVIPILMFISVLGARSTGSLVSDIGTALLQALVALTAIVVVGRTVLRPLFRLVASTQSTELFIAAVLFVIVATGVIAALAGLSMALGAFVAGLLLAETEYRKAIEATAEPFKGLLLGIFFFTVGMNIDVRELARDPLMLLAAVLGVIAVKAAIVVVLGRLFRLPRAATIETALLLGPGGEFAFVAIGLALTFKVIPPTVASFTLATTSFTMALIPLFAMVGRRLAARLSPRAADPVLREKPQARQQHAIVVGQGRVGRMVCRLLTTHNIAFTGVDNDARLVSDRRKIGEPVYYGDATDPMFLTACGLQDAAGLIITTHDRKAADLIVERARWLRPDIFIVARARDAEHAQHLYELGVSDAVPETVEASLQLSEAALVGLGVPTGPVIASIHEERDQVRIALQNAAKAAGKTVSRGLRAKS